MEMINNANPAQSHEMEELLQKNQLMRSENENLKQEIEGLESSLQSAREAQENI